MKNKCIEQIKKHKEEIEMNSEYIDEIKKHEEEIKKHIDEIKKHREEIIKNEHKEEIEMNSEYIDEIKKHEEEIKKHRGEIARNEYKEELKESIERSKMKRKHMELKVKYFDKNLKRIKAGMMLRHDDGEIEEVYETINGDLAFNGTNEEWWGWDGVPIYLDPLSQFSLNEWTIMSKRELKQASTQSKR